MIGKTLGHYEIIGKLGSGGMGDVYRGRDTKLDRELAIKVLPAHLAEDQDRRSRFTREAQAVAKLKHPNIITIHSVEEVDGVHFLTMEFVEGDTLAAMIPRDGLDTDRFFTYTTALADAVSAAHDEGITHRDLKPANIMFDKGGRLKVLDFGLAKLLEETTATADDPTIMQSGHTLAGQILGTAAYMSPEQAEGKPIDHRSDIFSLGILFYEMASGRRPFQGDIGTAGGLELFANMGGHGVDLPGGTTGGNDHEVGDCRFSGQRDGDNVFGLVIVERGEDQLEQPFAVGEWVGLGGLSWPPGLGGSC